MRKLYLKFVNIKIAILISVTLVELTNKIKKSFFQGTNITLINISV